MEPQVLTFTSEDFYILRYEFESLEEETLFSENPQLAAKIASLGMVREIGTVNDELARFIFDAETENVVPLSSLKAELVVWNNLCGVRITSSATKKLELRSSGFYNVIHPTLSRNSDGTLHSLYIFPEIINEIARFHGVDLTVVKTWGKNSIFGGFDPKKGYYQTNFWEIENNDALKFADLIRRGRIAFLGTHDLIAHIAGLSHKIWPELQDLANTVYLTIHKYFSAVEKPSIAALILPYTIGVILDDLAQPPSYGSVSHIAVLKELLIALEQRLVPPDLPAILQDFPPSFQNVITLSRSHDLAKNKNENKNKIAETVAALITEINLASVYM
ncbi:MAG: hypothetical protein ACXVCY_14755 [Pseudobdellovibrionaceae bacterium]